MYHESTLYWFLLISGLIIRHGFNFVNLYCQRKKQNQMLNEYFITETQRLPVVTLFSYLDHLEYLFCIYSTFNMERTLVLKISY